MTRLQRPATVLCCATLTLSVVGLVAAFLLSLVHARLDFDRAAISEEQIATVARIEAALSGGDQGSVASLLRQYRQSITRESTMLTRRAERAAEVAETARADQLVALSAQQGEPGRNRSIRRLVAAISAGERIEARAVALHMQQLRRRMTLLATLLTATALLSAILGSLGFLAANRQLATEVAARTAELAIIERSRRLFFAKVSHELRTPVTVMRGEAEVALTDANWQIEPLREALHRVVANSEFLEHRIAELLSLAQAENGELTLQDEPVDLMRVVESARDAAIAYAMTSDVGIEASGPGYPVPLRGDPRWLQQALVAIIDNAAKFSPIGGCVSLKAVAGERAGFIYVKDEGSGIPQGELPRIFDAYYQTEGGRARGGTGLGLALARWVIERHGGTISAGNDPAGGCVMTITLPLAA